VALHSRFTRLKIVFFLKTQLEEEKNREVVIIWKILIHIKPKWKLSLCSYSQSIIDSFVADARHALHSVLLTSDLLCELW
jgi:hypothetical protein